MSVVVGIVDHGTVYLASDSALSGFTKSHNESKMVHVGPAIVGWTGSPLWGTYVRNWAKPLEDRASIEFFAAAWCTWARERQHGNMDGLTYMLSGSFLIGTARGELFEVTGDGAVCQYPQYLAIGAGEAVAMGAIYAALTLDRNEGWEMKDAAVLAVEAAIAHAPGCGGAVTILSTNPVE